MPKVRREMAAEEPQGLVSALNFNLHVKFTL
jgi:hypothetical protein